MLESIKQTEVNHGKQLAVGHRELIGVLELATNKIDRQAILTRSDEELAELTGVSERSASRLKKVLRDYGESQ